MVEIGKLKIKKKSYQFEVKKPSESKGPWDLYKTLATIPGAEAFRPLGGAAEFLRAGDGRLEPDAA